LRLRWWIIEVVNAILPGLICIPKIQKGTNSCEDANRSIRPHIDSLIESALKSLLQRSVVVGSALFNRELYLWIDLTWLFWTKLCEKLSLERSFGYAEEEVQR
jgi:hypothetical protein